VTQNGKRAHRNPRLAIQAPGATPEEAAAIAAAIEQFMAETQPAPAEVRMSPWQRAALREGTSRSESLGSAWG
jgi:hypothetical protein